MSKFNDAVLVPELGTRVLDVLSRYQPLPEWGLLAGQAVASAIDEVLGTGTPVYNDIDWFVPEDRWERDADGNFRSRKRPERSGKRVGSQVQYKTLEELHSDGYDSTMCLAERSLYTVTHAEDHGMLNKVAVAWDYSTAKRQAERPFDLIQVFDTNNVQASVDLSTGLLTVTPAYREFFRTRQLKLDSTFTPVQSLLRFLKKADELPGVYADVQATKDLVARLVRANEGARSLHQLRQDAFLEGNVFVDPQSLSKLGRKDRSALEGVRGSWLKAGAGLHDAPLCFGPKYRALYDRFADQLDPLFTLTERKRGRLWLCTVREDPPAKTFALGALTKNTPPKRVAQFHAQQWLPAGKLVSRRRALLEVFLELVSEEHLRRQYLQAYMVQGDAYLEGLDSERTVKELAKVAQAHVEFFWATVALPMAEQVEAMRTLRRYFKKFDLPEAWGVLRGVGSRELKAWLNDEALMQAKFKALEGTKEPMIERLDLPAKVGAVEVVELVSQYDLNREGAKMSHCVAGYGPAVARHQCRIISFRAGPKATDWATAEWTFSEDRKATPLQSFDGDRHIYPLKVVLSQLRSHANTAPPENLKDAELQLRQQLDAWLVQTGQVGWERLKPGEYARRVQVLTPSAKKSVSPVRASFADADDHIEF